MSRVAATGRHIMEAMGFYLYIIYPRSVSMVADPSWPLEELSSIELKLIMIDFFIACHLALYVSSRPSQLAEVVIHTQAWIGTKTKLFQKPPHLGEAGALSTRHHSLSIRPTEGLAHAE